MWDLREMELKSTLCSLVKTELCCQRQTPTPEEKERKTFHARGILIYLRHLSHVRDKLQFDRRISDATLHYVAVEVSIINTKLSLLFFFFLVGLFCSTLLFISV